ncbi:MAG: heparan-alpha-glucosaminide N-acetyltransferase domain-containing protein, partial [Pseudomonadota bacterium]
MTISRSPDPQSDPQLAPLLAMILMTIYHFCFDLNQMNLIHQNLNTDEFWLNFRALIMTLFLSLVG